jgi:hypothetical protein
MSKGLLLFVTGSSSVEPVVNKLFSKTLEICRLLLGRSPTQKTESSCPNAKKPQCKRFLETYRFTKRVRELLFAEIVGQWSDYQHHEWLGYWGIGLLMFLENLFSPHPTELIMPLAGFTAAKGEMNFQYALLCRRVREMC